ncbi:Sec20-domain-containing protein [Durotheca rogersii]|uniref:Sec20-domain-containing protein n=1 Tax=Durotheca rogersii TaxID=419775 RepID=UPI002220856E|nr:Sec20-domain-containing protein [Durotheca rogersii]KAI5862716.1 Sec20-domain-containing protein [Durotheca rogersii]
MSSEALARRFTDLQDRLTVLQDATNQLKELIDRLANFHFQPGSVPLDSAEDDHVGTELSLEINQVLREQEEELELLQEEIIDIPPNRSGGELAHDRDRLTDGANRLGLELQGCRKALRRAQISAKRNLELAQRRERELLYASFSRNPRASGTSSRAATPEAGPQPAPPGRRKPGAGRAPRSKEEQMLNASSDVTESLRRTHDMMAAELSKSDFAHAALRESTAALSQLSDNYSRLETMLSSSRALLGTLLRSQKTDTWYLQSAFYLLVVTVAWLIFRRLLWGPTWWLVWLPLKLLFRGALFGVTSTASIAQRGSSQGVDTSASQTPGSESVAVYATTTARGAQLDGEGAPTVQVNFRSEPLRESPGSESMVEHVGKVIDEAAEEPHEGGAGEDEKAESDRQGPAEREGEQGTVLRERRGDEPPNPKKRVMEDDPGSTGRESDDSSSSSSERRRDEL